jgi:hypothetical protein
LKEKPPPEAEIVPGLGRPSAGPCFKCERPAPKRLLHGASPEKYDVPLEAAKRAIHLCDECFVPRSPAATTLPWTNAAGRRHLKSGAPPGVNLKRVDKAWRLRELYLELPSANGDRSQIEAEIARLTRSLAVTR